MFKPIKINSTEPKLLEFISIYNTIITKKSEFLNDAKTLEDKIKLERVWKTECNIALQNVYLFLNR